MAASLSRPDPTSPASVAEAGFSTSRRGYQPDEVRAFLTAVAAEMGRLKERERQLDAELRAEKALAPEPVELDDVTVTNLLGEETLRVLQTARESANQIKVRAEENAARVIREAHDEANRLRQEAEVEAARQRHDAQSDAEAEVAIAKQQGREMVTEARAYRERVLADLERRTRVARQHIDELSNGRDRLLQVFERARLVAVDITTELQRVDGPDEYVSFAPTTGPVPLMVPAGKLDAGEGDESDTAGGSDPSSEPSGTVEAPPEVDPASDTAEPPPVDTIEASEPSDTDAPDATDEGAPPAPEATVAPARDTNVVALFPSRGGDTDERPDVDGIFARLRSEAPAEPEQEPVADVELSPVVEATAFTRRDETIVPLIVTAARKLKRVLADEQNGLLDTLRRKEPVTSTDALVPAIEVHAAAYLDAITDELLTAAVAGAAEFGAKDTKTLRRTLDKAGALDTTRAFVRTDLVGPLRARIERSVAEGAGDNDDTTKRVRAVYREWKTHHIDAQLDDVFRFAFGGGLAVTAEPGRPMVWTIDPGEAACADCEDNSLAGALPAGESYPTGHTSAPAHPGCRCLTLPSHQ